MSGAGRRAKRYTVEYRPSAAKVLGKLPVAIQRRLVDAIDALAIDPRPPGCLKLEGPRPLWRIRVGDYRVVYRIEDAVLIVVVVDLGYRKDVYRD